MAALHKREHQICVNIIEARNVIGLDTSHMSDLLCTVSVGPTAGESRSTETKYGTVNCVWEQTFLWEGVALTDDEFKKEKIRFQLLNRNVWRKNALIGQFEFSVDNVYRNKNHEYFRVWIPLALPDAPNQRRGLLLVSLYVLKPNDPKPSHEKKESENGHGAATNPNATPGSGDTKLFESNLIAAPKVEEKRPYVLNALIYRGAHILATHAVSHINPFVSIRFNGNTIQTKYQANTSNPIWNVKCELPFYTPLASDSVEVQLWNFNPGLPDTLIGTRTFSFFHLRLTHKAWGPEWVNLYSSNFSSRTTTVLGRMQDSMSYSQEGSTDNEYVGRVLLRLSVADRDVIPPRLLSSPCQPALDPAGVDYTLYCLLYSGSEVPVQGAYVMVEVAFGAKRSRSEWVMGSNGLFQWNSLLKPIDCYCPIDTGQIHDIILNVYYRMGSSTRKISFERIPVSELLMGKDKNNIAAYLHNPAAHEPIFFVNGTARLRDRAPWRPVWRTLRHVMHDREHPNTVPGFLLCSLGFGLKNCAPAAKDVPQNVSAKRRPYILRAYIHQAANLLPADASGSANPFLVVRFGDKHARLSTQRNTLYPFWYECVEIEVSLPTLPSDLENAPSVFLQTYHEGVGAADYTPLGRCEVLADHIDKNSFRLYRYRLRYDKQVFADQNPDDVKDTDPYVLCAFELFHPGQQPKPRDGWVPGKCFPPVKWKSMAKSGADEKDSPYGALKKYALKFEAIGLRNMAANAVQEMSNPVLELLVPNLELLHIDLKEDVQNKPEFWQKKEMPCADIKGAGAQIMRSAEVQVCLHTANLHGVPLCLRLVDRRPNGDRVIGTVWRPVADFIDGHIDRPPWYNYDFKLSKWDLDTKKVKIEEESTTDGAAAAAAAAAPATDPSTIALIVEEKDKKTDGDGVSASGQSKAVEGLDLDAVGDDLNARIVDQQTALIAPQKPFSLDDDGKEKKPEDAAAGAGGGSLAYAKESADLDSEVKGELELRAEHTLKKTPFYTFTLRRGKVIGFSYLQQRIAGFGNALGQSPLISGQAPGHSIGIDDEVIAKLKSFIRVAPVEQQQKLEQLKDLLEPITRLYEEPFVARVYVYKAMHLAPRDRRLGVYMSAQPFLVVRNGTGANHLFNEKQNAQEGNLAPEFYQHFDLPTKIPDNNELTVAIWDTGTVEDDLIGSTVIDVEDRLLLRLATGEKEWRRLGNPAATTPQGKVLIRLDVLTEAEAARNKADTLDRPAKQEYELRLVIWSTKECRLPEERQKNSEMDQRLSVTCNFEGQYGRDVLKWTDTAWYAAGGNAEWNYRMKYRLTIPTKVPRLKFQLWSAGMISDGEACGEILYNLQPFFARVLRDKLKNAKTEQEVVTFAHPNYPGVPMGDAIIELWMLSAEEADLAPVGEAQSAPNCDPYLPDPSRNPPPWAVGTRALDALDRYRYIAILICLVLIAVAIAFAVWYLSIQTKA